MMRGDLYGYREKKKLFRVTINLFNRVGLQSCSHTRPDPDQTWPTREKYWVLRHTNMGLITQQSL